jgi:hypothetical protein
MGKQYSKVRKRARRKAYLDRVRSRIRVAKRNALAKK